ncbi:MAG: SRPBCC family protein [bacterium]|nr:SRPBCC family protein [bacterium]
MIYTLETDQTLPRPLDDVFPFFADAGNLEAITPPELRFTIETPRPIEMRVGALIEYRLTLYGVRFSWLTEISVWEPGVRFVDQQILGPFALWHHEHRFTAQGERSTRIQDTVHYALPLDPIGRIAHPLVRKQLDRIFDHRTAQVDVLLGEPD